MKKKILSVVLALMLIVSIGVSAAPLDFLRDAPKNYTSADKTKMTWENPEDLFGALEEGMIVSSIFNFRDTESESVIKYDLSDDCSRLRMSMQMVSHYDMEFANLSAKVDANSGVWFDYDVSDITNPKCVIIMQSPEEQAYQYVNLFDMIPDAEEKTGVAMMLRTFINEEFVTYLNDAMVDSLEKNADIKSTRSTVTIKIDNDAFSKMIDDVISALINGLSAKLPMLAEALEGYEIPSFATLGLTLLGDEGVTITYNSKTNTTETAMDIDIGLYELAAAFGEDVEEAPVPDFNMAFNITQTAVMSDIGKTVVEMPVLTEENSEDVGFLLGILYDDFYEEDDYEEEYVPEYPYHYVDIETQYMPKADGIYVPFRQFMQSAYGENVDITYENGVITAKCEYFDDIETLSFKVGDTKANIDGYDFEVGKIILENGTTYVSADFVEILLGYELYYATYDLLDETYCLEFLLAE